MVVTYQHMHVEQSMDSDVIVSKTTFISYTHNEYLSQILVNVLMVKYDLLMELLNKKEDLKFVSMEYGVQYVIHHGVLLMVMSFVILWDMMVQVCHVYYRVQTQYINYDLHSCRSMDLLLFLLWKWLWTCCMEFCIL